MIGKSFPELIFIRCSISLLRVIPIIAALYSAYRLVTARRILPHVLEYWLFAECLFHVLVYLPRRQFLQRAAVHPPVEPRARRQALFDRCLGYLPDPDRFTATWFMSQSSLGIKRENFVDWLLWALFATDRASTADPSVDEELNEYLAMIENVIGRPIEPGRNASFKPMRLTLDPVVMLPRPIAWYTIVAAIDCATYASLYKRGFRHYTPCLRTKVYPPRPQTLLSRMSVAPNLPYWYRSHRSSTKTPVVMLHGIGVCGGEKASGFDDALTLGQIGLWPYVPFLTDLARIDPEVGILAIEILPISMRITSAMLSQSQFVEQLTHILAVHNILEFVLVSHSYGSILTTHILRSSLAVRIASLILIDPVSLLLHLGDVAYNFVYRAPSTANQWQLWYFASRDMGVSHTLSRHFFWGDNILWKKDLEGRRVGVVLSGEDQIVDSREVWRYLTGKGDEEPNGLWKDEKDDLNVLWYPRLDHAQVFETPERRRPILQLVEKFSSSR